MGLQAKKAPEVHASTPILMAVVILVGILGLALIGAGIWLVYLGATGNTEVELFGNTFKSQNVGVVGIFCGAVFAVLGLRYAINGLREAIRR